MEILVVDDSKVMRSLVQRAIRQAGYRTHTFLEADSGLSALECLKSAKPRLILSDWNMPGMSGIEFLTQLRAQKINIPFGFITSESSQEIRTLAANSGANFILNKPFSVDDVQGALSPVLG